VLTVSWELALRANGYADNTVRAYQNTVRSLASWLAEHHPEAGPTELERQHVRAGWSMSASAAMLHPNGMAAAVDRAAADRRRIRFHR
jgi:site-specific recombinase XerD